MKLFVYARNDLIAHTPDPDQPALLLEGSWPEETPGSVHGSLDRSIDGRFDWIDRKAADWAGQLGSVDPPSGATGALLDAATPAFLNGLALRYYLVKLLRLPVYFDEVRPLRPGDRVELIAAAGRDEDYVEVLWQYCRSAEVHFRVRWITGRQRRRADFPPNAPWRRWAARLSRAFRRPPDRDGSRPRVVLCGNPRLLGPVCRELLLRRCDLWWLYDRFALKAWLRWQAAGVEQLTCDSSLGERNRLAVKVPHQFEYRGVNLAEPIRRWLAQRAATHGPRQTRLVEQIDAHFQRIDPEALVLDEDATAMARAVVAVGRRHGVRSLVVQHGVPACRFGFAPPAADRVLVWGRSSQQRLIDWGVPAEQIRITGSPQADALRQKLRGVRQRKVRPRGAVQPPRILLLATTTPRNDRPDAVALHLTRQSYAGMLRMAFAVTAGLEGAELIVKLHPRSPHAPVVRAQRAAFPAVRCRTVYGVPLAKWLPMVDGVLSCGSTAGVEASLAGVPVIQLAPPGASDVLPHEPWGLAGTARCEAELRELLAQVLAEDWQPASVPETQVFAHFDQPAAARIAEEVLTPTAASEEPTFCRSRLRSVVRETA